MFYYRIQHSRCVFNEILCLVWFETQLNFSLLFKITFKIKAILKICCFLKIRGNNLIAHEDGISLLSFHSPKSVGPKKKSKHDLLISYLPQFCLQI